MNCPVCNDDWGIHEFDPCPTCSSTKHLKKAADELERLRAEAARMTNERNEYRKQWNLSRLKQQALSAENQLRMGVQSKLDKEIQVLRCDLQDAKAEAARLREALGFTLGCLKHHHMTKPGISTLVEKAEALAAAKEE
jgi:hypothetical protein